MLLNGSEVSISKGRSALLGAQHVRVEEGAPSTVGATSLHSDIIQSVLRRSEDDLTAARESLSHAEAEIAKDEMEISQLEKHVSAIEADVSRYREQAIDRGRELGELRTLLGALVLSCEDLQNVLCSERRESAVLRRLVAELGPKAQSNVLAIKLVGARTAERQILRAELRNLQRELDALRKSTFWRLTGPARRAMTVLRSRR